jgi:Dolichyl-phosphate-mannose-protein mannosyltransferase
LAAPAWAPTRRPAFVILAAAAIVAFGVRAYHLDRRTITHPEVFAPGIPLPSFVTFPSERLTARDVLRGSLDGDIHPPGYYLVELAWTSMAGATLFALRLPSVLFGTATVILIYFYGRRAAGPSAAILAAWLLALHGEHVFWSQHARMWAMLACLATASALLLAKLVEEGGRLTAAAYALVTAAGLWTEYYFWPFFAAQVIWVVSRAAANREAVATLDAQALAAMLASPMLLYLRVHATSGSFIPPDATAPLLHVLPFANVNRTAGAAGAAALAWGVIAARGSDGAADTRRADAFSVKPWILPGALLASLTVALLFGPFAARRLTAAAAIAPWAGALLYLAFRGRWLERMKKPFLPGWLARDLTLTLLVVPLTILGVIHLAGKPVLVDRGLVLLAPFVALTTARGIAAVRRRGLRAAAVALVIVLGAASTYESLTRPNAVRDYRGLAEQIAPRIQPDDVVVVENTWWATPLHFYLQPDRYRLIPPESLPHPVPARVWVAIFGEDDAEKIARIAARDLPEHEARARFSALRGQAVLFERLAHR